MTALLAISVSTSAVVMVFFIVVSVGPALAEPVVVPWTTGCAPQPEPCLNEIAGCASLPLMSATPNDVIGFWRTAGHGKWFAKDARFDEAIRLKFEPVHHAAARGAYDRWTETAEGCLALLILLDQFPRNLWRGSPHAFATDPLALSIARRAVQADFDQQVEAGLRLFFYLPFEHSEDPADQDLCVTLCEALRDAAGDEHAVKAALVHRDVIARFGRFPHRNRALGRETTAEEQAFLDEGGFAG